LEARIKAGDVNPTLLAVVLNRLVAVVAGGRNLQVAEFGIGWIAVEVVDYSGHLAAFFLSAFAAFGFALFFSAKRASISFSTGAGKVTVKP